MKLFKRFVCTAVSAGLMLPGILLPVESAAASSPSPGVTSKTITIGIPYVNLASVAQFTHGLNQGNYQAVYQALINNINAHGGIDGRKIKAYYAPIDPRGGGGGGGGGGGHHIVSQRVHPVYRGR